MASLCERAGRLTAKNGGFRPGQESPGETVESAAHARLADAMQHNEASIGLPTHPPPTRPAVQALERGR